MTRFSRRSARRASAAALAFSLCSHAATSGAATLVFQAEDGEVVRGRVERAHAGATGNGYVNYVNETGSYVAWVLEVGQAAGDQALRFRFANGAGAERPMRIVINDRSVGTLRFPSTGSWSSWQTLSLRNQTLRKGLNTVRAESADISGGPNLDSLTIEGTAEIASSDWAQALIYSTIGRCRAGAIACDRQSARYPDPAQLGPGTAGTFFRYAQGLVLLGMHQTFLRDRTRLASYRDYMEDWFDARTDRDGKIVKTNDIKLQFLDTIMAGRAAVLLHEKGSTDNRYKRTADVLWNALTTHGRTPAGDVPGWPEARILWHAGSARDLVLLDGAYMSLPFIVLYGGKYGRALPGFPDIYKDAAGQLIGDRYHLQDVAGTEVRPNTGTKLVYHGYDKQGNGRTETLDWSSGNKKHSDVLWGRAMGWYAMTLVDVLDGFPTGTAHARHRAELIAILNSLLDGLRAKQRPDGLWNTVVHHPVPVTDNFTETSSTAMFVYAMSKAIANGYVDASYKEAAGNGYRGVLSRLSLTGQSPYLVTLAGTAEGQSVQPDNLTGDTPPRGAELYTTSANQQGRITPDRRRNPVDDNLHGIGSFLLMYEQVRRHPETVSPF